MDNAELSVLRSFEVSPNPDMLVELSEPDYPVIRVNAALERLLHRPREAIVGRPLGEFIALPSAGLHAIDLRAAGSMIFRCESGNRAPFWCRLDVSPVPGEGDTALAAYARCTMFPSLWRYVTPSIATTASLRRERASRRVTFNMR